MGLALLFSVLATSSDLVRAGALAGEPPPTEAPWPNGKGPR